MSMRLDLPRISSSAPSVSIKVLNSSALPFNNAISIATLGGLTVSDDPKKSSSPAYLFLFAGATKMRC